ncbi:hypothetical protein WISP_135152 [Willisornis vidua]|uniref:Uncharacterized protein n=1 Tax=Willisornis vidua TaxID=1566151 RepID=A0ABQ9CNF1_9PASS|nr:hypothetical protein WISP_135152 [Willisornis vidua]
MQLWWASLHDLSSTDPAAASNCTYTLEGSASRNPTMKKPRDFVLFGNSEGVYKGMVPEESFVRDLEIVIFNVAPLHKKQLEKRSLLIPDSHSSCLESWSHQWHEHIRECRSNDITCQHHINPQAPGSWIRPTTMNQDHGSDQPPCTRIMGMPNNHEPAPWI